MGRFAHQRGHMLGEVVHERNQEVPRAHGRIDHLEIEHRFRRIETVQFFKTQFGAPAVARQF